MPHFTTNVKSCKGKTGIDVSSQWSVAGYWWLVVSGQWLVVGCWLLLADD